MLKSNNVMGIIYIVTFSIAFISKIGYNSSPEYIQYSVAIFWIAIALLKILKNKFKLSKDTLIIKDFLFIFITPKIIIHAYSILLFILGETNYITRNTKTYLIVMAAFSVIYIFKENVVKHTIKAMCLSYTLTITYNIIFYGLETIPSTIMFLLSGDLESYKYAKLYEVHDYTFALGYLILYYLAIKEKFTKLDLIYIYILIVFLIFGFKRIQILAILLVIIYIMISKFIKNKYKFYKITSYAYIVISYIFIWMLSSSYFFELLNKLNINSMGRNFYYKIIIDYCEFSPNFLGWGRNWVSHILVNNYSYLNVGGVHSDILKYFAECGFILFGIWMWYFMVKVLKILKNKCSMKTISCYYILTLYTFIIYYTDNIDTYFISNFIYIIIVVSTAIRNEHIKIK